MSDQSNNQGRAYEFICLLTLSQEINKIRKAEIEVNSAYHAAEHAWDMISDELKSILKQSATAAVSTIFDMEPMIVENSEDILSLEIQTDNEGKEGDVRDIVISRKDIKWEIGLSLKHNHFAVKHSRLEELMREKGEIENSLAIWKENETNILRVSKMLNELAEKSDSAIIDDNISTFNEFFATYTAILYTDSCVIGFNKQQDGEFPIRLGNIGGVGSEKKKGLISAFDLAYYSFAEKKSIICPRFIVHDKMETTDKKQLREIFNITAETKAQLIIPILNEKLDFLTEEQRNKHIILELSNDDKFFRI